MTSHSAAPPPLIIVAASARALAVSACRAGYSVHAADLFADADLCAAATVAVRVPAGPDLPWPLGLAACVRRFPVAPWCYGGALENHPDLVDRIAGDRPLAGNAGRRLRAVRDPAVLARAVRAIGLGFPETVADPAAVPADGSFVVKPRHGAGGRGIAHWHGGPPPAGDRIWQRFVPGRPWSTAFAIDARGARLVGASRQLVGRRWCGARGFAWCGAVDVPLVALAAPVRSRLERLGAMLADEFGLVGLVGADAVVDAAGTIHVLEINPRPTASMELVERATGESMVATHLEACGFPAPVVPAAPQPAARAAPWAKAVVFAGRAVTVDEPLVTALTDCADRWADIDGGWPPLADLPTGGTTIAAGRPVLTVFAAGRDAATALHALHRRVAAVRAILRAGVSPPGGAAWPPRPPRGSTA
jgi:predicted ATP-grasp superfamily ATP-dependent carboligase